MKIAALLQLHARPDLVERLVDRLSTPLWNCYAHVDAKADAAAFRNLAGRVVFTSERARVFWGGYSQIEATLHLLRLAYADLDNTHFYLMSGQCFPIKSDAEIEAYIIDKGYGGIFMTFFPFPTAEKPLWRVSRWHFDDSESAAFRFVSKRVARFVPRKDMASRLRGIPVWTGSQWWMLNRPVVGRMLDFLAANSWYARAFQNTHCPDEMFFQTLAKHLGVEPDGDSPTIAKWIKGNRHPEPVTRETLEEFKRSWHFCARKFV